MDLGLEGKRNRTLGIIKEEKKGKGNDEKKEDGGKMAALIKSERNE